MWPEDQPGRGIPMTYQAPKLQTLILYGKVDGDRPFLAMVLDPRDPAWGPR